jgi:hypothetical protein
MIASGRTSGVATESEWAGLYTISRGQVIREEIFFDDNAAALKAVGLEG